MKYLIFIAFTFLVSCTKDYSYEKQCGIVIGKTENYRLKTLYVKYKDHYAFESAGSQDDFKNVKIGDTFCK